MNQPRYVEKNKNNIDFVASSYLAGKISKKKTPIIAIAPRYCSRTVDVFSLPRDQMQCSPA